MVTKPRVQVVSKIYIKNLTTSLQLTNSPPIN